MDEQIKLAYRAGYNYAVLTKSAKNGSNVSLVKKAGKGPNYSKMTKAEDINRMLLGTTVGATSGALLGGPYRRTSGAIAGGLTGLFASNPKLVLALLAQGAHGLYDFAGGKKFKK